MPSDFANSMIERYLAGGYQKASKPRTEALVCMQLYTSPSSSLLAAAAAATISKTSFRLSEWRRGTAHRESSLPGE